jgi:hypothetical protein
MMVALPAHVEADRLDVDLDLVGVLDEGARDAGGDVPGGGGWRGWVGVGG